MRTCETCRFWDVNTGTDGIENLHLCKAVVDLGSGVRTMDRSSGETRINSENSWRLAFVSDGDMYTNQFYTMPVFGCVLHQPKETT